MRVLVRIVVAAIGAIGAIGAVFFAGMRWRWKFVLNNVRKFSRPMKPMMMKSAGKPGAWTSIVKHVGRKSGTQYETPVVAARTEDGFVIALPYGQMSDWVKNVLAAGRMSLVYEGATYDLEKPEIVPVDRVNHYFAQKEQRSHERFALPEALQVHQVAASSEALRSQESGPRVSLTG